MRSDVANAPAPGEQEVPKHFYSLDALRGLAALSVVFWHWQHFFFVGGALDPNFRSEAQPFYHVFRLLYQKGILAVDLFFCLSGFVFFFLYAERIRQRKVPGLQFAVWRFSRLYPLHLITLLVVLAGQMLYRARFGEYWIYPYNDAYHFILNLFFASSWGWQRAYSFNGPIWSVSIEVLLYAIFFLTMFLGARRWHVMALAAAGLVLSGIVPGTVVPIAWAAFLFFTGGLSYYLYERLAQMPRARPWTIVILLVVLWIFVPVATTHNRPLEFAKALLGNEILVMGGRDAGSFAILKASSLAIPVLLFPGTIAGLALLESRSRDVFQRLRFLGDLSYSCYLLHFPLQLAFILATSSLGIGREFFNSGWSLFLFFVILIPASLCSYHFVEKPAQDWIRKKYGQKFGVQQRSLKIRGEKDAALSNS